MKTPILALALGAGLIVTLAGCTAGSTTADPTGTKAPTSSATATNLPTPADPVVNTCVDGNAVLTPTAKNPTIALTEACDTVSIVGVKGKITLGPVQHLVFEGEGNTVTVDTVTKVDFGGNDNAVVHGGAAPVVTTGTTVGNTVSAK